MPMALVALAWGSRSISSVWIFFSASAEARLTAVVVLPTPPFWLAMVKTVVAMNPPELGRIGRRRKLRRQMKRKDAKARWPSEKVVGAQACGTRPHPNSRVGGGRSKSAPLLRALASLRLTHLLLADEVLDLLAAEGLHVDFLPDGTEADQAFGEQLARAQLQRLGVEVRHDLDDVRALADMRALVGPDIVGDMTEQLVIAVGGGVDEVVDGLEHADLAEEVDLRHGEGGIHRAAAGGAGEAVAQLIGIVTRGEHGPVADLGVAGLVPGDASEVVFRVEIL